MRIREVEAKLSDTYDRVKAAAMDYLRWQVLATRQIQDGKGSLDPERSLHRVRRWLDTPPEEAVVTAAA